MSGELSKIVAKAEDFYEDAVYLFKGERYGACEPKLLRDVYNNSGLAFKPQCVFENTPGNHG